MVSGGIEVVGFHRPRNSPEHRGSLGRGGSVGEWPWQGHSHSSAGWGALWARETVPSALASSSPGIRPLERPRRLYFSAGGLEARLAPRRISSRSTMDGLGMDCCASSGLEAAWPPLPSERVAINRRRRPGEGRRSSRKRSAKFWQYSLREQMTMPPSSRYFPALSSHKRFFRGALMEGTPICRFRSGPSRARRRASA